MQNLKTVTRRLEIIQIQNAEIGCDTQENLKNPLDTTVEKNTSHKPVLTSAVNILHVPLHKHKSDLAFVTLLPTYIF